MTDPTDTRLKFHVLAEGVRQKAIMSHNDVGFSHIGQFALELVKTFACAGEPDGETSAGYTKMRPLTAPEIVEKAVETAELLFDACAKRGWTTPLPPIEDLLEDRPSTVGFLTGRENDRLRES